ncbi:hypothetical protein NQ317_017465 [Molorchus minor]|uniref:Uncharacterized protein n=1 Tax=Molorchus minor TaxID=1323400 RepID=A0ABQ9IZQ6_9CUCU|nr:hypothetical protein NQ317_017465 [Molorchus minor]
MGTDNCLLCAMGKEMDCNTGQDFITQFHNLHGVSVKERTVSFFKLLRKKDLFENEEATNWALNNLQPKNVSRKTLDLLEIVKQGNEIFISKILKQPWFFKDAFTDMSADELVNEFLPHTSFSIRMKILKNLSRNLSESQMDEIFDCVFKRYGLYIASNFLHVCSPTKIKEVLGANKVILYSTQVKKVLEKDLNTFKIYLDYYKIHKGYTYSNKNVINYVAITRYLTLPWVGVQVKKIVSLVKDDIPKDVHFYISFLNCSIVKYVHCLISTKDR